MIMNLNPPIALLLASSPDGYFCGISAYLRSRGYIIRWINSLIGFEQVMGQRAQFAVMFFSPTLPGLSDFEPFTRCRRIYRDVPMFLLVFEININNLKLADLLKANEIIRLPVENEVLGQIIDKRMNVYMKRLNQDKILENPSGRYTDSS